MSALKQVSKGSHHENVDLSRSYQIDSLLSKNNIWLHNLLHPARLSTVRLQMVSKRERPNAGRASLPKRCSVSIPVAFQDIRNIIVANPIIAIGLKPLFPLYRGRSLRHGRSS